MSQTKTEFMSELKTERLILRMFRETDFEQYAAIMCDAEVTRYLGDGMPLTRADAWRQLAMLLGHWQLRGYGHWAVEELASGRLVGRVGFFNPEGWPGFELGWTLGREFWGRGYATEAARRALRFGFKEMAREHVISLIRPENVASIKVAERLGERLERTTELFGTRALVYGISRDEWRDEGLHASTEAS
jgi:RimJ/RimL family protein N-acetyltransferase